MAQIYLAESAGKEADLEHDLADGEEWSGGRSEVNYRRVRGSNYRGLNVEVRYINHIYEFNEEGDNIIVFAPRGVHTTDVSIRMLPLSMEK